MDTLLFCIILSFYFQFRACAQRRLLVLPGSVDDGISCFCMLCMQQRSFPFGESCGIIFVNNNPVTRTFVTIRAGEIGGMIKTVWELIPIR